MTLDFVVSVIIDILLLPLQAVFTPLDALLAKIPGIGAIPSAINAVVSLVGSIPSTLVSITGLNPVIWNALFLIFLLYIGLAPGINVIKKVWSWIRP